MVLGQWGGYVSVLGDYRGLFQDITLWLDEERRGKLSLIIDATLLLRWRVMHLEFAVVGNVSHALMNIYLSKSASDNYTQMS